jgi:4-amino-4-deoxy-L-arabinose transferase-like glycosyltransferase
MNQPRSGSQNAVGQDSPGQNRKTFFPVSSFAIASLYLVVALVTRLPTFLRSVMDWDESLYFLMAQQWRAGHLPYTTLWDNKPLGIYAIFAVFQWVFGNRLFAMRIAAVIFPAITAFLVFKLVQAAGTKERRTADKAALVAGLAYLVCSVSNDGLAANTELFMAAFTCGAAWCAVSATFCANHPTLKGFCTGLLLGFAFIVKYVILFEAPAVIFALLFVSGTVPKRAFSRTCLAGIAGGALPLLLTVLLYLHAGDLRTWADASLLANLRRAGGEFSPFSVALMIRILKWLPLDVAALLVISGALRKPRPNFFMFLALWLLGGTLGIVSAKSFYSHYFLQILPAQCVSLGLLLLRTPPALRALPATAAILLIPIASALITLGLALAPVMTLKDGLQFHPDTPEQIAADLAAAPAGVGPKLYVFDYEPVIYALTNTPLPSRYAYPAFVTTCFLARVAALQPQDELRRILSEPPQFVVVGRGPVTELPVDPAVYADMRNALAIRYLAWKHYDDATVYQLRPPPLAPLPPQASDGCKN